MPSKALIIKANKVPKYSTREQRRCRLCGRSNSFKDVRLCRISFRKSVYEGLLPGWRKGSW